VDVSAESIIEFDQIGETSRRWNPLYNFRRKG